MSPDALNTLHTSIMVLNGSAALLLGWMLWTAAATNYDPFTKTFLRLLAAVSWAHSLAIVGQMYRAARILAEDVPVDGALGGLAGRIVELAAYCVPILFLLRPSTKKALNGGAVSQVR